MTKRHLTIRSLIFAATLAFVSVLGSVATVLADSSGAPFPK